MDNLGQESQSFEQIITTWQEPLYNLALRMLGNTEDAMDVTQDIFAQLLQNLPRYDAKRPFRPWVYKLATNAILNFIRSRKTQKRNECEVMQEKSNAESENQIEKNELEAIVQSNMQQLPEEFRSLLVLHYYQGLSQTEMAEAAALPRTTVQSKLQKALDLLKKQLAASGYMSIVPSLEVIMKSAKTFSVPLPLSESLVSMAATSLPALTVNSGLITGGIFMTKKLILGALVLGISSLGIGLWAGKEILAPSSEKIENASASSANAKKSYKQLLEENQKLLAQIVDLQAANQQLQQANGTRQKLAVSAGDSSKPLPELQSIDPKAENKESTIDWQKFGKQFGEVAQLIMRMNKDPGYRPSMEEQAKLSQMQDSLREILAQANAISDQPFFDQKIFPNLLVATFANSLHMNEAQQNALRQQTESILQVHATGFDFENCLPLEKYRVRQQIFADFEKTLQEILDAKQLEQYAGLSNYSDNYFEGNFAKTRYGLSANEDGGKPEDYVLKQWSKAFDLQPEQSDHARVIAANYVNEGRELLKQYGQTEQAQKELSAAEQKQLYAAMYDLQIRMEKQLKSLLTARQLDGFSRRVPYIIQFEPGGNVTSNTSISNSAW